MKLKPFLLDQWLASHEHPPIEFNLAGSTGPRWTLGEVLDLEAASRERLFASDVVYAPSAGKQFLREAIAWMQGVEADQAGFPPYAAIPEALGLEVRPCYLRGEAGYAIDFADDRGIQFVSDEVFHPIYHIRPGISAGMLPHATVIGTRRKLPAVMGR